MTLVLANPARNEVIWQGKTASEASSRPSSNQVRVRHLKAGQTLA